MVVGEKNVLLNSGSRFFPQRPKIRVCVFTPRTYTLPLLPFIVYANKGEQYDPDQKEWIAGTAASDQEYVEHAKRWVGVEGGGRVKIVGGCCRTTPSTITALRQHLVSSSEKHL